MSSHPNQLTGWRRGLAVTLVGLFGLLLWLAADASAHRRLHEWADATDHGAGCTHHHEEESGIGASSMGPAALHDHGDSVSSYPGDHESHGGSDHGEDVGCVVCAFANHQVDSGAADPVMGSPVERCDWMSQPAPTLLLPESVWPEPSGRGPPSLL